MRPIRVPRIPSGLFLVSALLPFACESPTQPAAVEPRTSPTPAPPYESPPFSGAATIFANVQGQLAATRFQVAADSTIHAITWWGIYEAEPPGGLGPVQFRVQVHGEASAVPEEPPVYADTLGASLRQTALSAQGPVSGRPILEGSVVLPDALRLQAGRSYWISIDEADERTDPGPLEWLWCAGTASAAVATRRDWDASPWALEPWANGLAVRLD